MRTPIEKESRQLMRVQRAINMLPTNLPSTATTMIATHISQLFKSFNKVMLVRNPVKTKNSGNSEAEVNDLILSFTKPFTDRLEGITTPARNPPNSA
jgi:hypothetical protein